MTILWASIGQLYGLTLMLARGSIDGLQGRIVLGTGESEAYSVQNVLLGYENRIKNAPVVDCF